MMTATIGRPSMSVRVNAWRAYRWTPAGSRAASVINAMPMFWFAR